MHVRSWISLFYLFWMRRCWAMKDLWILRHGQATHNPRAEAAKDAGCSHERFLELMREDDSLDSPLTPLGQQQADAVAQRLQGLRESNDFDLVVSSPLSRALETADRAWSSCSNRVCIEGFREINGWLLNAKRRSKSELEDRFPHWDVSHLEHHDDVLWTDELETNAACSDRGYAGLQWIYQRPESSVLLVAHGGILRFTMDEHPLVRIRDDRLTVDSGRSSKARFSNCELRRYRLDHDGESKVVTLTEVDLATQS